MRNLCRLHKHREIRYISFWTCTLLRIFEISVSETKMTNDYHFVCQTDANSCESRDSCYSIFSFICMCCRSLFDLLYFFFWPLCCLFFFDIWIMIPLWYLQTFCNIKHHFYNNKLQLAQQFKRKLSKCKKLPMTTDNGHKVIAISHMTLLGSIR